MLNNYFDDIFKTYKTGDATEPSYYGDLKKLLENWSQTKSKNFHVTTLPKRTEVGNPDFRVWDGKAKIVGYIEAKDPSIQDLETVEDSEQLKRYRNTFPNLILTNFFEFRLYRNGQLINQVLIGRPFIIHQLKTVPPVENQENFIKLLEQFFSFSIPVTTTAKSLAIELAKRTRFLRDNVIAEELKEEEIEGAQTLEGFFQAFKDHLIANLTTQDFANLFAQTITYGLFAARSRAKEDFNRELAYKYIPPTIGILRKVFQFISSSDLPISMGWIIDDIAEVLANSDVQKIISDFYQEGKGRDPIIHFYETFLAEYDPKEREKRGVYYTPEPVVSFITRSIHKLLKEKFDKANGFATQSVTVLDPAAGTLTFPAFAINLAISEFKEKYGEGGVHSLIKDHILKNFYAFELMMAPYAIGHLKMGLILDHFDYQLSEEERFNLYLTNTLDFSKEDPNKFPGIFEQTIAKESQEALKVKEDVPVMVIMGNPPYSGVSENKGEWILDQIKDYKQIDGKPLGEHKDWLQDDYVKFFRFSQWKLEQNKVGILAFITNHGWLDNPTFRGMRSSILKTFDEVYVLNLHGSHLKKEKTPIGEKDENVFDIQTGVAITIGIKNKSLGKRKVLYADLWGLREEKYQWLDNNDFISTKWQTLNPTSEYYFLIPRNEAGSEMYQKFQGLKELFPTSSTGVATNRDEFVTDHNLDSLKSRINLFRNSPDNDEFIKQAFQLNENYAWRVASARKLLKNIPEYEKYFIEYLYRPFDRKYIYFHPSVVWRTRENTMKHMVHDNLALCVGRSGAVTGSKNWDIVFASDSITDLNLFRRGGNQFFPLYVYPGTKTQKTIFDGQEKLDLEGAQHSLRNKEERKPNIDEKVIEDLKENFGTAPTPEEIFYYIYAVLYSNTYRQKYQEFLKIDFPRIPFTKDYKLFKQLVELGHRLVDLHLLRAKDLEKPISKFQGEGDNIVGMRKFIGSDEVAEFKDIKIGKYWAQSGEKSKFKSRGIIMINDEKQFFGPVPKEVWDYYIGGYQVLDKWLKDRKGCVLSSEDIKHYCKIVTALTKTIEIQKEIDRLYPNVEKSLWTIESR